MKNGCYVVLWFTLINFFSCSGYKPEILSEELVDNKYFKSTDAMNTSHIISNDEFQAENEILKSLLATSYAGFDDMRQNGFDINEMMVNIENSFSSKDDINIDDYYDAIAKYLAPFINDAHFNISLNDKNQQFVKSKSICFTNTYVKKNSQGYSITQSDQDDIFVGDSYNDKIDYLFLYPAQGVDTYRLGSFDNTSIEKKLLNVKINNITHVLKCEYYPVAFSDKDFYKVIETEQTVYIYIYSFFTTENNSPDKANIDQALLSFMNLPGKINRKKNIILDIRNNAGGASVYSFEFLKKLYCGNSLKRKITIDTIEKYAEDRKLLSSPAISQAVDNHRNMYTKKGSSEYKWYDPFINLSKDNKKVWFRFLKIPDKKEYHLDNPSYKGNLYILTSKNTASASEECIWYSKMLFGHSKKVHIIGENSAGCINYGFPWEYTLPHSKIKLRLSGGKITLTNYPVFDGIGYFPDYWSTGKDILKTLVNLTGDVALFTKLPLK